MKKIATARIYKWIDQENLNIDRTGGLPNSIINIYIYIYIIFNKIWNIWIKATELL
jgi:hypothetical protein